MDGVVCLGDVVGYGADPRRCLEIVRRLDAAVVVGNHEHGCLGLLDLDWFHPAARAAVEWTASQLSDEEQGYLRGLPFTLDLQGATLVHASPHDPRAWEYLITARDGFEALEHFAGRLCFVGHSHRPGVWSQGADGYRFLPVPQTISLDRDHRFIVNVGSVGQPRDRDPRAAYAVWDTEASCVTLHRVPYDLAATQAKIYRAGLPRILGERLAFGA